MLILFDKFKKKKLKQKVILNIKEDHVIKVLLNIFALNISSPPFYEIDAFVIVDHFEY